ncbi:PH domain-containing protein [soil metagenome]
MEGRAGTKTIEVTAGDRVVSMRRLDPRVRVFWALSGLLSSIPWVITALVIDLVLPIDLPTPTGVLTLGVAGFFLLLSLGSVPLRYRAWAYAVGDRELWIRRGLLSVATTVIPYRRLQFTDTRQGPLERMMGLAEVIVHTASPGTSGRLVGLAVADAEALRDHLASLISDDDVV